jgi:16S rRNA (uracil1498-N3)-methyltransferase
MIDVKENPYICCKNNHIMHLFYAPGLKNNTHVLTPDESRHCIKSLRLGKSDFVHLTDGRGNLFRSRIVKDDPRRCVVEVEQTWHEYGKRSFSLHLAVAPTKNIKRYEWFLEKVTELGIDEITPLLCFHSERKQVNPERMNRILISAMKQSLKTYLPELHQMRSFADLVRSAPQGNRYLGYCEEENTPHLKRLYHPGENALILIGPEGDFSQQEVALANDYGFQSISLGQSRLRTETAGVVAAHSIHMLNER